MWSKGGVIIILTIQKLLDGIFYLILEILQMSVRSGSHRISPLLYFNNMLKSLVKFPPYG